MVDINCSLSIPEVEGLKPQQLTVGRHFNFVCQGQVPSGFDFSKASVVLTPTEEAHKYEYVLVKAQIQGENSFTLDMVSYVTGQAKTKELTLSDGSHQLTASIQAIQVDSILPPPEPPMQGQTESKPPEPYGYVISHLHWPVGYTIFFIVVFCASVALIIQRAIRFRRLRRLLQELQDYSSAAAPDAQFYKSLRALEKNNYPIQDIEKQFRTYVIRKYQVPLFGLSLNESMRFLKKKWPTLTAERRELKNILLDLKKMSEKPNLAENSHYLKKLYQFVDHTEQKMDGLP